MYNVPIGIYKQHQWPVFSIPAFMDQAECVYVLGCVAEQESS